MRKVPGSIPAGWAFSGSLSEEDLFKFEEGLFKFERDTGGGFTVRVWGGLLKSWECRQSTQLVELRRFPWFGGPTHSPSTSPTCA